MPDRLFKVEWPAGTVLVHAKDEEQATRRAAEYLAQPTSKRLTATEVLLSEVAEKPDAQIS